MKYFSDLLNLISERPWRVDKQGETISIRSGNGPVLWINNGPNGFGQGVREANAEYVTRVCNVAPQVHYLLGQALRSDVDTMMIVQQAYNLLNYGDVNPPDAPKRERKKLDIK